MAQTFTLYGTKYTVSDDGQTVMDPLGRRTAISGLDPTNPLAQAAQRATEEDVTKLPQGIGNPALATANVLTPAPAAQQPVTAPVPARPTTPIVPAATTQAPVTQGEQAPGQPYGISPMAVVGYEPGTAVAQGQAVTKRAQVIPVKEEADAYAEYVEASRKVNEANIEAINQQAEYQKQIALKSEDVANVQRQVLGREQQRNVSVNEEIERQNRELQAAQKNLADIKPRDFWADRSTFSRIMAGISIGFGAAAQAMGAGSNPGLEIIKSAIQTDLEKQRQAIELAQGRIVNARNAIGLASTISADTTTRDRNAMALAIQAVGSQIDTISKQAGTAEMQQRANLLKDQFGQWAAEQDLARQQALRTTVETATSAPIGGGYQQGMPITAGEAAGTGIPWYRIRSNPELRRLYVPEDNVLAWDIESAKKIRDSQAFTSRLKRDVTELRRYYAKGNKISRQERQSASAVYGDLFMAIKGPEYANAGAALTETELKAINKVIGSDPTAKNLDAFFEAPDAILSALDKLVTSGHQTKIRAYGQPIYGRPGYQDQPLVPGKQQSTQSSGYQLTPH